MDAIAHFCDLHLGKGVVYAKDTPNFIANRIGIFSVLNVMRLMQEMDLSDRGSGRADRHGRGLAEDRDLPPIDLVGLDILGHVVRNMTQNIHDERSDLKLPDFYKQMLERKWLGDKTKGGFYKKTRSAARRSRKKQRLALDWKTLEYRPPQKPKFPALEMAKNIDDAGERAADAAGLDGSSAERQGERVPVVGALGSVDLRGESHREISDIGRRDRSRHEAGLQLGDGAVRAVGCGRREATVERMKNEGKPVSPNVEKLLASGKKPWYTDDPKTRFSGRAYFDLSSGDYEPEKVPAGVWSVDGGEEVERRGEEECRALRWSISATASAASSSTRR